MNEKDYILFFESITERSPFAYQVKVARLLCNSKNIILRAPTGAGKTLSVLVPFLYPGWHEGKPSRLIYALPLRTLAQGVYAEAVKITQRVLHVQQQVGPCKTGSKDESPIVTMQTGEQPDDPFFTRGQIIVTTYDQVLSGLLNGPFGLSGRLHNINSAALVGSMVIFDEFHLMPPKRAFLTGVAGLHLFRKLCQSVWMTATATKALSAILGDAIEAVPVPETEAEESEMHSSLPSVAHVSRNISAHTYPLDAPSILRTHLSRSLVLMNTVGRAQQMYLSLIRAAKEASLKMTIILLHSQFFRSDRKEKEEALRSLFGPNSSGNSILVATQVIEAGLDISCEHLHTELCPMNALIQRAGRCARFKGETGTVHAYSLPSDRYSWLPYGDLAREDETLTKTRNTLNGLQDFPLNPKTASEWIQRVHGDQDALSVREGWRPRLTECLRRIGQIAVDRNDCRISDLIRGDDSDRVSVIVMSDMPPDSPGQREALSLSRRSLARLLQDGNTEIGWIWDCSDECYWKPLTNKADLKSSYVVCLRTTIASYNSNVGLQLGITGAEDSPPRIPPKRPGYAPLKAELWAHHALAVADATEKRLEQEGYQDGIVAIGIRARYQMDSPAILEAAKACALLHDLGKLQTDWQRWAEASQTAKDSTYQHKEPLAHTDFDAGSSDDRKRERELAFRRPPHATASAYFSGIFLAKLLNSTPNDIVSSVASACAAAIVAHHGGWWTGGLDLGISPLCIGWETSIQNTLGWLPTDTTITSLNARTDKQQALTALLKPSTSADQFQEWWPLVAYFTRTLRLSDQLATAEGSTSE